MWQRIWAATLIALGVMLGFFYFAFPNFLYGSLVIFLHNQFGISEPDLEKAAAASWLPLLIGFLLGAVAFVPPLLKSRALANAAAGKFEGWPRLTDHGRSQLIGYLNPIVQGQVVIFYSPTQDCHRLASDFRALFLSLNWNVIKFDNRPSIEPGITIETIPDSASDSKGPLVRNIREFTGANRLMAALQLLGYQNIKYKERGGSIEDYAIHLLIGIMPEPGRIEWQ